MFLIFPLLALAENPTCPGVKIWYHFINDSQSQWIIQVSHIFDNTISFVDEGCAEWNPNHQMILTPSQNRAIGMKVNLEKSDFAAYSFMGVNVRKDIAEQKDFPACSFFVAPYAEGKMDRLDWKLNNADCYSKNYGLEMHFK